MSHAPVALFVYDRLVNLKRTVSCLQQNSEASDTDLYVFSDAWKDEKSKAGVLSVRDYVRTISGFRSIRIVEREKNFQLEYNIIRGIDEVLEKFPYVIVIEDDICTSRYFLSFMNDALVKYCDVKQVMSVSGFTNLNCPERGNIYFTPHMSGWGWGTWKDRWEKFRHFGSRQEALAGLTMENISKIEYGGNFRCLHNLDRNPIPWDICWTINIVSAGGLCINPTQTLVRNIGLTGGTHFNFKNSRLWGRYTYDREPVDHPVPVDTLQPVEDMEIEKEYAIALKDHGFRYNLLGRLVRSFYLSFIKHNI